ncbi:MAG TPA: VOC family protein [Pyrinomonadaceae bacterium]|nr:VOC family protein [Pyrinomonadaceae bacterium]
MAEHTISPHGSFCWNELATTDAEAAKKFYSALLGWQFKEGSLGEAQYSEIIVGGESVGGIYQMGPEFGGAPPHWMAYVAVEDVDGAAARVEELGGKVCVPPTDIPTVGRFSVINDPSGATLSLIKLVGEGS